MNLVTFRDLDKVRYEQDGTSIPLPVNNTTSAVFSKKSYDEPFDDAASDIDALLAQTDYELRLLSERLEREAREAQEDEIWRQENMAEAEYWGHQEEKEYQEQHQHCLLDEDRGRSN